MNRILTVLLISALYPSLAGHLYAQSSPNYHLIRKTTIGGEGGWDYLLADTGRLNVSHGNQTEVVDLKSHAKIGVITPTPGVHGIARTLRRPGLKRRDSGQTIHQITREHGVSEAEMNRSIQNGPTRAR